MVILTEMKMSGLISDVCSVFVFSRRVDEAARLGGFQPAISGVLDLLDPPSLMGWRGVQTWTATSFKEAACGDGRAVLSFGFLTAGAARLSAACCQFDCEPTSNKNSDAAKEAERTVLLAGGSGRRFSASASGSSSSEFQRKELDLIWMI